MKTTIFCCALTVSLGTSLGYAQSVEELLGLTVPGMQAPASSPETSHATAEESPFYVSVTVDPLIQGNIHVKDSTSPNGGNSVVGNQIKFNLGVGVGVTLGYRIPDSYVVVQVSSGFLWNQVREFNGTYQQAGAVSDPLRSTDGHLYQVPILVSGGLEFDLSSSWPFLHGGVIRFGPTVGVTYYDLTVQDIERQGVPAETRRFGNDGWAFAYGAFLSLDFFFTHNVALSLGYQFMGTTGLDYGGLRTVSGNQASTPATEPDMKANFSYVNIVKCGVSIYF